MDNSFILVHLPLALDKAREKGMQVWINDEMRREDEEKQQDEELKSSKACALR